MNTEAVMCMALQSNRPSRMPLLRSTCSTRGVMFSKAIRAGRFSVKYSVWDFTASLLVLDPSEIPAPRNHHDGDQPENDRHRHADAHEVDKPVATGAVDHQVGLITDGCHEAGGGGKQQRHEKRHG